MTVILVVYIESLLQPFMLLAVGCTHQHSSWYYSGTLPWESKICLSIAFPGVVYDLAGNVGDLFHKISLFLRLILVGSCLFTGDIAMQKA
jgi:hypothetical protein